MVYIKSIVYSLLVVAICAAEEESQERADMRFPFIPGFGTGSGGMQFPNFPGFGGGSGSQFPVFFGMPMNIPSFPSFFGFGGSGSSPPSDSTTVATTAAARNRRAADESEDSEASTSHERQSFFGQRSLTPCNYTTEPGATCTSCSEALLCFGNNVGISTQCAGFFRHCRNGHCSIFPSDACKSSPTTTGSPSSTTSDPSSTSSAESFSTTTTN